MKFITKKIVPAFIALGAFLLLASPTQADEEIKKLTVDLKAKGFTDTVWQDNLDSSKIIFGPNDKFQYQIKIKNEGNRNQTWINIKTNLPQDITTSESMTFQIPQLTPNEEYIKNVTFTIKDKAYVNKDITKNIVYTVVKAESGLDWSDESYFYTNNGTKDIGTTTTGPILPASGMPIILVTLIASGIAGAGILARRYARGY